MTEAHRRGLFSSKKDDWQTPQDFFNYWDGIYHFTLDAAADSTNHKCDRFFTIEDDGLHKSWGGETVWCNPPYGKQIAKWVQKSYEESLNPGTTVVCLLPARTDTGWFHEYCTKGTVYFVKGRLKFDNYKWNAPFPSIVVVFGKEVTNEKTDCSTCHGFSILVR